MALKAIRIHRYKILTCASNKMNGATKMEHGSPHPGREKAHCPDVRRRNDTIPDSGPRNAETN